MNILHIISAGSPFWHLVVVITLYGASFVLEADVIETSKRCTVDVSDFVIRDKKELLVENRGCNTVCTCVRVWLYLPPHEHTVWLLHISVREAVSIEGLGILGKARELAPMLSIHFLRRVPFSGEKWVAVADDFPFKESSQCGVFL